MFEKIILQQRQTNTNNSTNSTAIPHQEVLLMLAEVLTLVLSIFLHP